MTETRHSYITFRVFYILNFMVLRDLPFESLFSHHLNCSCTWIVTSVRFVRGVRGFNPHWLMTTPSLVTAKFDLGVGFDPLEKSKIQIRP